METIDNDLTVDPNHEPAMALNSEAQYYLQQAGKWASFLGITGFIFTALILILAATAGALMSYLGRISPTPMAMAMGPFIGFIYLLVGVFYFFFSLYLYQFGSRVKKGIAFIDNNQLTKSLSSLKSFFKLWVSPLLL